MRLLRYDAPNKRWVQLFTDSSLDKHKNLKDLTDLVEARRNLELDKYFWNKDSLRNGTAVKSIHNVCIIQDKQAQFISQADRDNWNQKVDRPKVSIGTLAAGDLTEGQMHYDPSTDRLEVKVDGKIRQFENNRATSGIGNFPAQGKEVAIPHLCKDAFNNKVIPKYVGITCQANPQGLLGEYWARKDDTNIYVGNTGSYTGRFEWFCKF